MNSYNQLIKDSYNIIAKEFSQTRNYNWPEFEIFYSFIKEKHKGNEISVIDIGCGNGRLYNFIKGRLGDFNYVGVDISDKLLEEAKKDINNAKFICLDMVNLDQFADNSFDLIFSIASFHHIYLKKDRIEHLKHLKRIMKPNGNIFITNWNLFQKKYTKCFFKNILQKKTWNDCFVSFSSGKKHLTERFYHAFTPYELRSLYKTCGLTIEKEFFMKGRDTKKSFIGSFNICHILGK